MAVPCDATVCRAWPCVQPLYVGLAEALITATATLQPGIYADAVDGLFLVSYGSGAGTYLAAWRGNWHIEEFEAVIEEVPVRFYRGGGTWVADLAACLLNADCGMATRICTQRTVYNG